VLISSLTFYPRLQGALSVKFGDDAKALYVGSADHNLRIYGAPPAAA